MFRMYDPMPDSRITGAVTPPICQAFGPTHYLCSRTAGHEMPHLAVTVPTEHVVAEWDDDRGTDGT